MCCPGFSNKVTRHILEEVLQSRFVMFVENAILDACQLLKRCRMNDVSIEGVSGCCVFRFRSMVPPRPAVVSIFADGSVMVTTAGAELGQGMFTKVKQARACIFWFMYYYCF